VFESCTAPLVDRGDHHTVQGWDQSRNGTEEIFRRIHDVMGQENILSISMRNSDRTV
jgi:hypothetical protein